jgi:hypothetical protein
MVMMEMLCGGPLIDTFSKEDQIVEFKRDLPESIGDFLERSVRRNRDLMRVLKGLLNNDPAERYQSANEADNGTEGARVIHQQLVKADLDFDYGLELENYVATRLPRSKVVGRRPINPR